MGIIRLDNLLGGFCSAISSAFNYKSLLISIRISLFNAGLCVLRKLFIVMKACIDPYFPFFSTIIRRSWPGVFLQLSPESFGLDLAYHPCIARRTYHTQVHDPHEPTSASVRLVCDPLTFGRDNCQLAGAPIPTRAATPAPLPPPSRGRVTKVRAYATTGRCAAVT